MHRWLFVFLVACDSMTSAGGGGGGGPGSIIDAPGAVGEPPELNGITLFHNQARAAVQTTTPLPALEWDPRLAGIAATWALMCVDTEAPIGLIDHDPNRSKNSGYDYVGENIFGSSGGASAQEAVQDWVAEQSNYTYATNTCAAGQVCGHYTQVVWRDTTHLGCALHDCPGLQFGSSIVCDYGPGGNVNGEPPY